MFNVCPECDKELGEDEYYISQDYICESEIEITTDINCACGYTNSKSTVSKVYGKRVII